jgi:Flp pilus assembly protein TadB
MALYDGPDWGAFLASVAIIVVHVTLVDRRVTEQARHFEAAVDQAERNIRSWEPPPAASSGERTDP